MTEAATNLRTSFEAIDDTWHPRVVAQINDYAVKAVKVQGDFVWHSHEDTDEMFLVVRGELHIDLRDAQGERRISLAQDDVFVIPRGVEHRPVSPDGAEILLLEPTATVNTGDSPVGPDGRPVGT